MKKLITFFIMLLVSSTLSYGQTEGQDTTKDIEKLNEGIGNFLRGQTKDQLKYYKEKYSATYTKSYEEVFNAIKEMIKGENCMIINEKSIQDAKGIYNGKISSDYCVFVSGDYSKDSLQYYSYRFPIIRGGDWVSGRVQYKFKVQEKEDATVDITLKAELSGREDNVTHLVHFWESNGILETRFMDKLKAKIESLK